MSTAEKEIEALASKYRSLFWKKIEANLNMDIWTYWDKSKERDVLEKELEKRLGRKVTFAEAAGLKKAMLNVKRK